MRTRCPFPRKTPIVPSALTPTIRYSQADPESGAGDFVGNVVGHGALLVFNFWHESSNGRSSKLHLYRVVSRRSGAARRCPSTSGFTSPGKG